MIFVHFFTSLYFQSKNFIQCIICDIVHSRLNSANALNISILGHFLVINWRRSKTPRYFTVRPTISVDPPKKGMKNAHLRPFTMRFKESNFNEKMDQNFHICLWSGRRGLTPPPTVSLTVKFPFLRLCKCWMVGTLLETANEPLSKMWGDWTVMTTRAPVVLTIFNQDL